MSNDHDTEKLRISQAIIVEGRDDVEVVSRACEALIIPTHGYGITAETWGIIDKAYQEKGIIILTDPDNAGERIRKRLTQKYPDAIQCWMARCDTVSGDDIGIENADPQAVADALRQALLLNERACSAEPGGTETVTMDDLMRLGLAGTPDAARLREEVCRALGIGYGNAKALLRKLRGWNIGTDELEETVIRIKEQNIQD
jgi:ribonuclease M5